MAKGTTRVVATGLMAGAIALRLQGRKFTSREDWVRAHRGLILRALSERAAEDTMTVSIWLTVGGRYDFPKLSVREANQLLGASY